MKWHVEGHIWDLVAESGQVPIGRGDPVLVAGSSGWFT